MEENEFELERVTVTTEELDSVVVSLKAARESYDLAKAISTEKYEEVSELEQKLIDLLTAANKSSYIVENVALITISLKTQVTTPKSIADKEAFFGWVEKRLGREGLLAYLTVNYQSLNSLYKTALEEAVHRGEDFIVPGLELPMVVKTLSMRAR